MHIKQLLSLSLAIVFLFLYPPEELYCQVNSQKPPWIVGLPYISSRIEGVGVSSSFSSPDSNIIHARENARHELARHLQVSIISETIDSTIYKRSSDFELLTESYQQNIISRSNETLRNSIIGDEWYDAENKTYYAYAYIELRDFVNEMEVHKRSVVRFLRNGEIAEESGEIEKALREYVNGLKKTYGIHLKYIEEEIDGSLENLNDLMRRKIENCLLRLEVISISNPIVGEYEMPLSQALKVRISYNYNNSQKPLQNFSVRMEFQKGIGILKITNVESGRSVLAKTDENGEIDIEIIKVLSVTNENIISVGIDLESIFGDEWNVWQKRFRNNLNTRFVYSSMFLQEKDPNLAISLNSSADEKEFVEGEQAELKVETDSECNINLFLINAHGELNCYRSRIIIQNEQQGPGWQIKKVADKWRFSWTLTFNTDVGEGVETIVCITTPLGISYWDNGRRYSKNEIMNVLSENLREDEYKISTISYIVKSKK